MRHRNMYYLTGLPGWMRFGFSPGWVGRSPTGMSPGASFLMTGQWPTPQAQAYWDAMQSGQMPAPTPGATPTPGAPPPTAAPWFGAPGPWGAPVSREQELEWLRQQAEMLKTQLDQISSRVAELEQES